MTERKFAETAGKSGAGLPLAGLKVVEFTHMVMGPAVGLILADLGAEVVKVEPLAGDNTRRLQGAGAGYFAMYNRHKRSLCLDLKSQAGKAVAKRLVARADVLIENFRPGAMAELGLGYAELAKENPRLIYCSAKGFLSGPYEHRTALDEVAQMMGGLAYMTGPPGRPLRAGASVIDVTGGMFAVIGVLAALEARQRSGRGQEVKSALFETTAFLVGQHIAQYAVSGKPAPPMSVRQSAWAVYEVFDTGDREQVFVAIVSDTQWRKFCEAFALAEFLADRSLDTNAGRVEQRERILPVLKAHFSRLGKAELMAKLDAIGLPFAPIAKPEELADDAHLRAGGLVDLALPDGRPAALPALPLEMDGRRMARAARLPREGEHGRDVLREAGFSDAEIQRLITEGILRDDAKQVSGVST